MSDRITEIRARWATTDADVAYLLSEHERLTAEVARLTASQPPLPVPMPVPAPTPVPTPVPTPAGELYVDPANKAVRQAAVWRSSRPVDAAIMDRLGKHIGAKWIGDWTADPARDVDALLTAAGSKVAVIVAYNIPNRDLGSLSAGGATDATSYAAWVGKVAAGIKGRHPILVLEPDALAMAGDMSPAGQSARLAMVRAAAVALTAAGARVYVDAGDSNWVPAETMAARLKSAGVAQCAGFALNTSHYELVGHEHAYAAQLRAFLGQSAHYVVDTGRCGLGAYKPAAGEDTRRSWCDPPGRALGPRPTLATGVDGCDAYAYMKTPGGADGCDATPGTWLPETALGMCMRAVPPLT